MNEKRISEVLNILQSYKNPPQSSFLKGGSLCVKLFAISCTLFLLLCYPAMAGTVIKTGIESVTATFNPPKATTEFYGVGGEFEINENWQINSEFYTTYVQGSLSRLSLSLCYKINDDYLTHIEPYLFAGIDPFFSQVKGLGDFGLGYHVGLGVAYVYDNTFVTEFATKLYLNNPFSEQIATANNFEHNFNIGTLGLNLSIGYRF